MNHPFGTYLRSLRLGWYWWEKEGVFVRISKVKLYGDDKDIEGIDAHTV